MSASTIPPPAAAELAAERFAEHDGSAQHPIRTIAAAYVAAWVALSGAMVVVGVTLTQVLLAGGRDGWDQSMSEWLADRRQPAIDSITRVATLMANTFQVVALVALACIILVLVRQWRDAVLVVSAVVLEVTAFLTANTIVPRERPAVLRLDSTPSTGSFPSGHVAASVALWCAVALVLHTRVDNRCVGRIAWLVAGAVALLVAFARAYRGMHHVTDVVCGLLLGVLAVVAALFVSRVVDLVVEKVAADRRGAR
jgi:undecaprenyl-diphosphatase